MSTCPRVADSVESPVCAARKSHSWRRSRPTTTRASSKGRIGPSGPVLASLARVLRLDDDQRTYMYELAGTPAKSRRRAPQKVKPYLQRLLDRIDAPAIVMTPTHDILAWNPLAAALMVDFAEIPERERNFMRLLFTDPRMRSLYPEWEELARSVVSYIRMEAARKPDDPRLAELVGDL